MKRGDIYFAALDPARGNEIKKTRPVLIVSNNQNNAASGTITIIPLTSNTKKVFSFEVFLSKDISHLPKDSKACCQQIRTIAKERLLHQKVSSLTERVMQHIDAGIRLHLDI